MNPNRLLILLLILSSTIPGYSQNQNKASIQAIKELKHGVLVVIIPSYHKKIEILEEIVNDPNTKTAKKKRSKRLIETTKKDQQKLVNQLQEQFIDHYDFSELALIHDTSTVHILKKGITKGIFLEDDQQTDLTDKSVFFLRYGHTDYATTTRIKAWIITDDQLQDLQKPFPYHLAIYQPLKTIIFSFLTPAQAILFTLIDGEKKPIGFAINQNFWTYYKRYH